jgi:hypothetical protein
MDKWTSAVVGFAALVFSGVALAQVKLPDLPPPAMPRGLVSHDSATTPGYVLFSPIPSTTTFLIDNDGQAVHTWDNEFGGSADYLEADGTLLRGFRDPQILHFRQGGVSGGIQEIDWDGKILWQWKLGDEKRVLHHDIERLPNGNVLALGWEVKTREESIAAGRRPDATADLGLMFEWVVEVQPIRPNGAKVVWEWHVFDHLIQDRDPALPHHGDPAAHPERLDANAGAGEPGMSAEEIEQLKALGYIDADAEADDIRADFLHANAIDYNAGLDQIALSIPTLGEVWIIDHSTTTEEASGSSGGRTGKGGDLLYRWGNPENYGRGGDSPKRLFFQHDVRWIPEGWAGAGNLTLFNNGRDRPDGAYSSVEEITPPLAQDGSYAIAAGQPYGPSDPAWTAKLPPDRFAPFISGATRLRNQNTFVCAGTDGILLELNPKGEIVWEYRNPYSGNLRMADGEPATTGSADRPYAVYRATRIPKEHPALVGKLLAPLDPQPTWVEPPAIAATP